MRSEGEEGGGYSQQIRLKAYKLMRTAMGGDQRPTKLN